MTPPFSSNFLTPSENTQGFLPASLRNRARKLFVSRIRRRLKIRWLSGWATAVTVLGMAASPSFGQSVSTWNGATTNWNLSTNWTPNGVPSSSVIAEFATTFSNQPALTASGTAAGLWLATGDGQNITVSGASRLLTLAGNATINGNANTAILLDDTANHSLIVSVGTTALTNSTSFLVNNSGTLTVSGVLAIANGTTLTLGGTSTAGKIVVSGAIGSTTGAVTVNTAGNVTLSGSNAYSGATTISGGTLTISSSSNLGDGSATNTISLANGAVLNDTTAGNIDLGANRSIALGSGGGQITWLASSSTMTVSGQISGSTLTIDGGGGTQNTAAALILSNSNSYTGGTVFNNTGGAKFMVLTLGNDSALGSGTLTINGARESIQSTGGSRSLANQILIATTGFSVLGSQDMTFNGLVTDSPSSATITANNTGLTKFSGGILIGVSASASTLTISGSGNVLVDSTIADSPSKPGLLQYGGSGVLTLSGSNTFQGALNVGNGSSTGGTVNLQNSAALAGVTSINSRVYSGNTLQLQNDIAISNVVISMSGTGATGNGALENVSGSNAWRGKITLNGDTTIRSDAGTLTLSASGSNALTSTTTANLILDGPGNINILGTITTGSSSGLNKTGAGIATLSGSNTYTGPTAINGGIINVGHASALGATSGTISFGGGTLQYGAVTTDFSSRIKGSTGAISIDTNGQNVTFASSLASSNTGGLAKAGSGTLTLTGSNAYSGATVISAGTVLISGNGAISNSSGITVKAGAVYDVSAASTVAGRSIGSTQLLQGNGTIKGALTVSGTMTPGESGVGTLTLTNGLSLDSNAKVILEISGTSSYDKIVVGNTASSILDYGNGTLTLSLTLGSLANNTSYTLFSLLNGSTTANDLSAISINGVNSFSDASGIWTYTDTANAQTYTYSTSTGVLSIAAVPEPQAWVLLGFGMAVLLGRASWRRVRQ